MTLTYYQIDAFADRVFGGNPAGVCPLEGWLPDATMQAIANEANLSEVAFFVPDGNDFGLRWFTPETEVELCGHATMASGHLILRVLEPGREAVVFHTVHSGALTVRPQGDLLALDLPARENVAMAVPEALVEALGARPAEVWDSINYMAVFDSAEEVLGLKPDMSVMAKLPCFGVIATAPGDGGIDFVSRYFAPSKGVPEDPVTGSAHCSLVPYWAGRLGKATLEARQVSKRGGALTCTLDGDRVVLAGQCALYLKGEINL